MTGRCSRKGREGGHFGEGTRNEGKGGLGKAWEEGKIRVREKEIKIDSVGRKKKDVEGKRKDESRERCRERQRKLEGVGGGGGKSKGRLRERGGREDTTCVPRTSRGLLSVPAGSPGRMAQTITLIKDPLGCISSYT